MSYLLFRFFFLSSDAYDQSLFFPSQEELADGLDSCEQHA